MKSRILVVDDEELIRWSLRSSLEKADYKVFEAESSIEALKIIENEEINLVILDIVLQNENGLDILKQIKDFDNNIQVIMMTAYGSVETAVEAMKCGALDYLSKPFNLDEVVLKVKKALMDAERIKQLSRLRKTQADRFSLDRIVYRSESMREVIAKVEKICQAGVDIVLLSGETGVGKGLLARAIHNLGPNSLGPFITLNCTAIPDNLFESELFGYERGAFTDAKRGKEGVVEQAAGGTLFLDEIGDMPYRLQGKLLRFIEEKRIRKVGGCREIEVDLKVIAATNRDLRKAIEAGEFRLDLYHRLNLIHVRVPPLRERKEDIIPLSKFFLDRYKLKYNKEDIQGIADEAYEILMNYDWPGNVRELSNVIERICILENTNIITRSQVSDYLIRPLRKETHSSWLADIDLFSEDISFESLLNEFKRHIFEKALQVCNQNKTKAAELLKMDRSTFKYQLKMVKGNSEKS